VDDRDGDHRSEEAEPEDGVPGQTVTRSRVKSSQLSRLAVSELLRPCTGEEHPADGMRDD
jgi:hypothetical protein